MKWANKEVKHYLALWLKERGKIISYLGCVVNNGKFIALELKFPEL